MRTKGYLKIFLPLLLLCLAFAPELRGQDFERALDLYQQQQYEEAAEIFRDIPTARARLFAGKSWFALGAYVKAREMLSRVDTVAGDFRREAQYTAGLAELQMGDFADALEKFRSLRGERQATGLSSVAAQTYEELLGYLTVAQRRRAFRATETAGIRYDLVRSAMGRVSYPEALQLVEIYRHSLPNVGTGGVLEELRQITADSATYANRTSGISPLRAPEGLVYDIVAALPLFNPGQSAFPVSQGLYYGYLMAVEDFNSQNPRVKAVLRHRNTAGGADSAAVAMTDFAWNLNAAAVLGPLFSDAAAGMAPLAEKYGITMLAPLANSDSLNFNYPYLYQANPTFATHGRTMARFARRQLQLDTLAVLVERGTSGESSAFAFRDEFERLGGKVSYFFSADLQSEGYEISDYTRYFTADSALIDSLNFRPVDAVYAPFTGQASRTLMELLLIDLNAMNPTIPVLGSPEWGTGEVPVERLNDRRIYFTESWRAGRDNEATARFSREYSERFGLEPNRYAMIGYDTAGFLLEALGAVQNPALLKNALKHRPAYRGTAGTIRFEGTNVNQHLFIMRLDSEGQPVPVTFDR